MADWQVFQADDRVNRTQDQTSSSPLVSWGPDERGWSQNQNCRQVGNQIICDDIYGSSKPEAARVSFALQENDSCRALVDLQRSMGLTGSSQIAGAADTVPPYYQPATLPTPSQQYDQYSFHQGQKPGQIGSAMRTDTTAFNPYGFHQGEKPTNPGIVPPYIKPNGHDVPVAPPKPAEIPAPPKPAEVPAPPKPAEVPAPPKPQTNPCQPSDNPCYPCNPCEPRRWHPGMIAGRVIGRVFGRCR